MAIKFGIKKYFKPTPVVLRTLGDLSLAVVVYLQLNPEVLGEQYNSTVSIAAIMLKYLTNCFTEVPNTESNDTETTVR